MTERTTSISLLERVREHKPDAWELLVYIYQPLVVSWVKATGIDEATALDITQEVWHSVTKSINNFYKDCAKGTFRGWLWTIARNKLNDLHRNKHPRGFGGSTAFLRIQELPEEEPADASGVQEHLMLKRALELIRPDFDEKNWKAFWRMTIDGWSAAEAGEEQGMAPNAVHQAKFRILKRLRQEMAGLLQA